MTEPKISIADNVYLLLCLLSQLTTRLLEIDSTDVKIIHLNWIIIKHVLYRESTSRKHLPFSTLTNCQIELPKHSNVYEFCFSPSNRNWFFGARVDEKWWAFNLFSHPYEYDRNTVAISSVGAGIKPFTIYYTMGSVIILTENSIWFTYLGTIK